MRPMEYSDESPFKVDGKNKGTGRFKVDRKNFHLGSTKLKSGQALSHGQTFKHGQQMKAGQNLDTGQSLRAKKTLSTNGIGLSMPKGKNDAVVDRYASIKIDKRPMSIEKPRKNWLGPRNRNARILM